MSDDSGTDSGTNDSADTTTADSGKSFSQADLDRIVSDRVARERARYADYGDLKKFKQSAMSDQDKAIAEAEQRGRTAALSQAGTRLAKAELRAAAAGRVDADQLDGFLEFADLAKFVGEDGEPNTKAIKAAVDRLTPKGERTNFDGGARTSGSATDMNALIRRSAGVG
jgi:hypothetical protein